MASRRDRRERYDEQTRVNLLEDDADELEAIDTELRAMILAVEARVLRRLNALTGVAVTLGTSILVAALSVLFAR